MQVQRIAATLYLVAAVGLLMSGFSAQPHNSVARSSYFRKLWMARVEGMKKAAYPSV
jgi:hypothetical protein